jgi:cyanophycinase
MQLLLNGGRNERGVLKYDQVLSLYKQLDIKRVLFIVYALVEEDWQKYWKDAGPLFDLPGMEMHGLTLFDTDPKEIEKELRWAEFIYLPGGSQAVLLKRIHELGTHDLLQKIIASGSLKLLGGGSAGAMVMSSQCIIGHQEVKSVEPGLNYLPGYIIDSHFSERERLPRLLETLQDWPELQGIGIDEDTAALFDEKGTLQRVYGPGTVTICTANNKTIYDQDYQITQ